jgi:hypothetical protein
MKHRQARRPQDTSPLGMIRHRRQPRRRGRSPWMQPVAEMLGLVRIVDQRTRVAGAMIAISALITFGGNR